MEFVHIAKAMQQRSVVPPGEARDRTIAGRAYYAAYLAVCDAMSAKYGYPPDAYIPHETLSQYLAGYASDPDVRQLGTELDSLRRLRSRADYKRRIGFNEFESDDAVDHAKAVMDLLPAVATKLPKVDYQALKDR